MNFNVLIKTSIFTFLLFNAFTGVDSSIAILFGKVHFYELIVNLDSVKDDRMFNHLVKSKVDCVKSLEKVRQDHLNFEPRLNTEVFIYPNHEQTLSFLVKIKFKSFISPETFVLGYELCFQQNDLKSCLQIIPDKADNTQTSNYEFSIKDPSFLELNKLDYSFYFGSVSVRALFKCDEKSGNKNHLCTTNSLSSEFVDIGIKANSPFDPTLKLKLDECVTNVQSQTCIMKYEDKGRKNDSYYFIIMHPWNKDFEKINSDLHVEKLTKDQKEQIKNAKDNNKSTVIINGHTYNISDFFLMESPNERNFVYHIESFERQSIENLVIKFVESDFAEIYYESFFENPTKNSRCYDGPKHCYCRTNDTCVPCLINKVTFNEEDPPYPILTFSQSSNKLSVCRKGFYKSFDFNNVKLAKHFQNQPISNKRIALNSNTDLDKIIGNRNMLARLCFEINTINKKSADVIISLKDDHYVARSSLIDEPSYTFKFYLIKNKKNMANPLDLVEIKEKLIDDGQLALNEKKRIKNLNQGTYLIEITPKQNSEICPGKNECIDEGSNNNEIRCIKCNKIITLLTLKFNDNIKLMNYFKCATDKPDLENYLNNKFDGKMSFPVKLNIDNDNNVESHQVEILSGRASNSFEIDQLILPPGCKFIVDSPDSLLKYHLGIIFIIISSLIIFEYVFFRILFAVIRDIFADSKTKVVFCLTLLNEYNDTNQNDENEKTRLNYEHLSETIKKITAYLEKTFVNVEVTFIDQNQSNHQFESLKNADCVFNVCLNRSQIDAIEREFNSGENDFQHNYRIIQNICKNKYNIVFDFDDQSETKEDFLILPRQTEQFIKIFTDYQNLSNMSRFRKFLLKISFKFLCFKLVRKQKQLFNNVDSNHMV